MAYGIASNSPLISLWDKKPMRHPMLARARGRSKPLKRRRLQALDGARGVIIVWGAGFAVPPERW